jgi:F-type H+-transporting ATPase subunit b
MIRNITALRVRFAWLLSVTISTAMLFGLGAVAHAQEREPARTEETNAHGVESSGPTDPSKDVHATTEHGAHGHHEDPSKTFNFFHLNYWGKDRYGGEYGDSVEGPHNAPEEKMSAPFVLMLVNFGLLLVILAKFGGPAARKMAQDRSDQIKTALDEASALRSKAAAKLAEYESRLAEADAEISKMVDGMRSDAATEKQRILEAAAASAAAMERDAELRIAAEIERARFELRAEVTAAAMAAAEKVLKLKTTSSDQTKLFEQFIGDMQQVASQRAAGSAAVTATKERS